MFENVASPYRYLLYAMVFPIFFQQPVLKWVWGTHDELYIALSKRVFLLLPSAAIILGCWISIACLLTVIIRHKRRQYVSTLFITWWDLFRAIFSFWGGIVRLVYLMVGWTFSFLRVSVLGLWFTLQDILLSPLRAMKSVGDMATQPGTPWIAVFMTLAWCALEAFIFTFIMTNLVIETISNITGLALSPITVQFFLYFMMLAFVIGSYAIVASLEQAIRTGNVKQIILVALVEAVALIFEVLFLYREFVDALVPWFAQYAGEDFRMGIIPVLLIASFVWAGIRGMTWFLFAAHGTPTIMAIIQRTGLRKASGNGLAFDSRDQFLFIKDAMDRIRRDIDWYHQKGEEIVSAVVLPPMQIIAAIINFGTMLVSARHLFQLPFKSYRDMLHADQLINRVKEDK